MKTDVTVAICTWNRAKLLDQTLTRMRELRIPEGISWELLVVNNSCTDETDAVIARHTDHLPLRRLFEPKQGLSNARNCAVEQATGELLLWTDDDVLVSREWLAEYVKVANEYPSATFFGGPIQPWFPATPPPWVLRHWRRLHKTWAVLEQRRTTGPLQETEYIFGANMAIRTAIARNYSFDPALGRKGKGLVSGEETAYLDHLKEKGYTGMWIGSAPVEHYIEKKRLTAPYIWENQRCLSRLIYAGFKDGTPKVWGLPRWVLRRYLFAALKARMLSLFKNTAWLDAHLESAKCRGILEVCWRSLPRSGAVASPNKLIEASSIGGESPS